MGEFRDISGQTFTFLTAIKALPPDHSIKSKLTRWQCQCICGSMTIATMSALVRNRKQSCGCLKNQLISQSKIRHGHSLSTKITTEYRIWTNMMTRCYNQNNEAWPSYGGRGIIVCERWHSFQNFVDDIGLRPSPKHTLDRFPNNNGNYEPTNCRWATKKEQARNRTSGRYMELNGRKLTIAEWSEISGIKHATICYRLDRGWPPEKAIGPLVR